MSKKQNKYQQTKWRIPVTIHKSDDKDKVFVELDRETLFSINYPTHFLGYTRLALHNHLIQDETGLRQKWDGARALAIEKRGTPDSEFYQEYLKYTSLICLMTIAIQLHNE